ncbi:helix-turn-helix domain-containing protein [Planococcus lenghuensis]|nr:helix-turn-helix transcriptional regulator [Planococcus lenghuensis]AQQ55221.1 hypothetical protein B0X71_18725 [Planococcus lenghuensis]
MAEALGVPLDTLEAWERGKKVLVAPDLARIADYFNVSTDFLLDRRKEDMEFHLQNPYSLAGYIFHLDHQRVEKEEMADMVSYIQARRRIKQFLGE